jgi:hypothetical protein
MLTESDIQTLFLTTIIVIIVSLGLVHKYINVLKNKDKRFVFNPRVLESFETWLNMNTTMYMTKYLEEKMGSQLQQEEELDINTDFAKNGIDYVTASLLSQMPIFYKDYMTKFHGEDRMIIAIREKVRYLFIKFIESMIKKRVSGGALNNTSNTQTEEN